MVPCSHQNSILCNSLVIKLYRHMQDMQPTLPGDRPSRQENLTKLFRVVLEEGRVVLVLTVEHLCCVPVPKLEVVNN